MNILSIPQSGLSRHPQNDILFDNKEDTESDGGMSDRYDLLQVPCVSNRSSEVPTSHRGSPLHIRHTRGNQILIKTFRELLFKEVFCYLGVNLDPDVLSVLVLYTFERTHGFLPYEKTLKRRTLEREGDILNCLSPHHPPYLWDLRSTPKMDYKLDIIIGRVLFGFDIHDSRYGTSEDPNPCEIMTNEGGFFLVPDKMADWFLNQDGRCVALPVRYRYKHRITDARVVSRDTGPYLQLVIHPIRGTIRGTEELLKSGTASPYVDSDLDSFTSLEVSDIDPALRSYTKGQSEDGLALEIEDAFRTTRESVLVYVPQCQDLDNCSNANSKLSVDFSDSNLSGTEARDEEKVEEGGRLERESVNIELPTIAKSLEPFPRANNTHDVDSDTTDGPITPVDGARDRTRPSIIASSIAKPSVLELGPGFIGSQDLSLSGLHCKATPNPLYSNETS